MITSCTTCGTPSLKRFLRRDNVPVHQNHPEASAEAALAIRRGNLHLDVCTTCSFVLNAAFDRDLVQYDELYESDQSFSPAFGKYVDDLVDRLVASGVRNKRILEIGCGTGSFLEQLCARGDNRAIGFDPAYSGPGVSLDGRVKFVRKFFVGDPPIEPPDLIFCRHVVGHIARPFEFLSQIRRAIGDRSCPLFIETPALGWSLDNVVIQDFFYEYCSYFSEPSLTHVVSRAGFHPQRLERVFDGQYFWLEATPVAESGSKASNTGVREMLQRVDAYVAAERDRLQQWRDMLDELRDGPPTCIWGAGAKGVTFLNMLDTERTRIACVVDINPRKQGKYVSGTGHPIESPEALRKYATSNVIIMNENYRREIVDFITRANLPVRVLP